MITRCAEFTWKASSSMPHSLLPYFVGRVAEEGGDFLIFKDEYIPCKSAIRHKDLAEKYAPEARGHLALLQSVSINSSESPLIWGQMKQAAESAGANFRLYVRDLTVDPNMSVIPKIPVFISAHPELNKLWDEGYSDMGCQLYHDPD